jgi:hypothetical protein
MEQIVFFLFGMLAFLPTCLLAMRGREQHTLHVHHWHHPAGPQTLQEPVQSRYSVLGGPSGPYVLDSHTGQQWLIVQPVYKAVIDEQI